MYYYVIYVDPADDEEKAMLVRAPNERLAMRAVASQEIVSVLRLEEEDDLPSNFEEPWNLY